MSDESGKRSIQVYDEHGRCVLPHDSYVVTDLDPFNNVSRTDIEKLRFYMRHYDTLTNMLTRTVNSLKASKHLLDYLVIQKINFDEVPQDKHQDKINKEIRKLKEIQPLMSVRDRCTRILDDILEKFPVYHFWLKGVPMIGPSMSARNILMFYYRFIPICPDCGTPYSLDFEDSTDDPDDTTPADMNYFDSLEELEKYEKEQKGKTFICPNCKKKAKGDGVLSYQVQIRDFPTVSKWIAYLGQHIDPKTGQKVKRKKAKVIEDPATGKIIRQEKVCNWNVSSGSKNCFLIGEQFRTKVGTDHLYRAEYERRRAHIIATKDITKGHAIKRARHEMSKLFQMHFWEVARALVGWRVTKPWIVEFGGHDHDHIVPPYYASEYVLEKIRQMTV